MISPVEARAFVDEVEKMTHENESVYLGPYTAEDEFGVACDTVTVESVWPGITLRIHVPLFLTSRSCVNPIARYTEAVRTGLARLRCHDLAPLELTAPQSADTLEDVSRVSDEKNL